ncbi:AGAP004803-PA-like protein [Anopheles sinensis]|uniref:AGAP004803-PA-like protein n=1 Tax=Anopheles sinensis TaxID=74873 RepID=A0A084W9P5_ANOSI|nr:AGAP004803-PA-like protein [Anopheles sinensis]
MVNLCNLLVKYSHFSKVDDDVFVYIDRILESAYEIYNKQQKAKSEIDYLNKQLEEKRHRMVEIAERSPSKASAKKRKVRSVDSSFTELKENVSMLEDSHIFPYKSDPETSTAAASILEQNIIDSEESFFALTQSPPRKDMPACINSSESEQPAQQAINTCSTNVSKPSGNILRPSRLSNESPSPNPALRMEPKSSGSSTPKAASGKWTAKKPKRNKRNTQNGRNTCYAEAFPFPARGESVAPDKIEFCRSREAAG